MFDKFHIFVYNTNHPITKEKIYLNKKTKLEKLYYTYRQQMFQEAFSILEDKSLAEDAVSESFVRIINNLNKIECDDSPRTRNFLLTICRNVALDFYRKRKHNNSHFQEPKNDISFQNTPENIVIDKESINRIMEIILNMDAIYKDTLLLNKVYHISRGDIAKMFGISPEAVTKRLQRAKAEIKRQLAKEEIL